MLSQIPNLSSRQASRLRQVQLHQTILYFTHQPATKPSYTSDIMSSLLHIARNVQAAVKAYNSVKENTDRAKWKAGFENEQVCPRFKRFIDLTHLHFNKSKSILAFHQAKTENPSKPAPILHPLLVALAIVLKHDEDFSLVTESHPKLTTHKYYDETAVFPDLSSLTPSGEVCWWEDFGASHFLTSHFICHNARQLRSLRQNRQLRVRNFQLLMNRLRMRDRQLLRSWQCLS